MIRTLLLSVWIFGLVFSFGCERNADEATQKASNPANMQKNAPVAEKKIQEPAVSPVDLYYKMITIRKNRPLNDESFIASYEKVPALVKYVKDTDMRYTTQFDRRIRMAMRKVEAETDLYPDAQMAEKTVQRAFLTNFFKGVDQLAADPKDDATFARVHEASTVLRNTASRRGKWTGKGGEYTDRFDLLLESFEEAVKKGVVEDIQKAGNALKAFSTKTLVLSVFYELTGLEKSRGKDDSEAREKRVEALVYYESIMDEHKGRNGDGAATVMTQLSQTIDQIDLDLVKTILKKDYKAEIQDVKPEILGL